MTVVDPYEEIARSARNPVGWFSVLRHLRQVLPAMWAEDYVRASSGPTHLLTVTFKHPSEPNHFVSTMFDHASGLPGRRADEGTEDRVVAVWGLSRKEAGSTRDKSRMAGFLRGDWSQTYPGDDRGHFFAHTMGGGMDINLFPQLASVNRGQAWRGLEKEAVEHPGTFCFIRPFYSGTSWRPTALDYGLYFMPPLAFRYKGARFRN